MLPAQPRGWGALGHRCPPPREAHWSSEGQHFPSQLCCLGFRVMRIRGGPFCHLIKELQKAWQGVETRGRCNWWRFPTSVLGNLPSPSLLLLNR